MAQATTRAVGALRDPDPALVALLRCLAEILDDPESATAAAAKEYRSTLLAMQSAAGATGQRAVADLDAVLDGG